MYEFTQTNESSICFKAYAMVMIYFILSVCVFLILYQHAMLNI